MIKFRLEVRFQHKFRSYLEKKEQGFAIAYIKNVEKKPRIEDYSDGGSQLRMDEQYWESGNYWRWKLSDEKLALFSCTYYYFTKFKNKLKAVVYTYIASQLYSNKDKEKLLKAFREMDKDGDGVLGKEELLQVFKNYNGYSFTE